MTILVPPWATNMEIKNVNIRIIDFDNSALTRDFIAKIESSSYFRVQFFGKDIKSAQNCINENICDIILELPNQFERDFYNLVPKARIYANAINSIEHAWFRL